MHFDSKTSVKFDEQESAVPKNSLFAFHQTSRPSGRQRSYSRRRSSVDLADEFSYYRRHYSITSCTTFVHLCKFYFGIGLVQVPNLFRKTGTWLGIVIIFVMVIINIYAVHILDNCTYLLERNVEQPLRTYVEMAELAVTHGVTVNRQITLKWKAFARYMVKLLLIIHCLCCSYVLFEASTMLVVGLFQAELLGLSNKLFIRVVILLIVMLLCLPARLTSLMLISFVGNMCVLGALAVNFRHIFCDLPDKGLQKPAPLPLNWGDIILYALNIAPGVALMAPLQVDMKKPKTILSSLTFINAIVSILFIIVCNFIGLLTYWRFGRYADSYPITYKIYDDIWLHIVYATFAFNLACTIPLYIYIMGRTVWDDIRTWKYADCSFKLKRIWCLILFIPMVYVYQSYYVALYLNAFAMVAICLVMPTIIELTIYYNDIDLNFGYCNWRLIVDSTLLLCGFYTMGFIAYSFINSMSSPAFWHIYTSDIFVTKY